MRCDVLVTGEYYCDLIFSGLDGRPELGSERRAEALTVLPGGTYNTALALTRLGLDIHWACDFGTDIFSALVLEQAARDGLNRSLFNRLERPLRRVTSAFSRGGDRGFVSYGEAPIVPPPSGLLDKINPGWLLQTFRFEPEWLAFMRDAKARGAKIFADCRGDGGFTLETPGVREFLSLVDVFSPNADEAHALTGHDDAGALEELGRLVPVVVIKRGATGAVVLDRGRQSYVPAPEVEVRDTTGAGDIFNGGFLLGLLNGLDAEGAAELGVLCGSLSVTGYGASAAPTLEALRKFAVRHNRAKLFLEALSPS